VGRLFKSIR